MQASEGLGQTRLFFFLSNEYVANEGDLALMRKSKNKHMTYQWTWAELLGRVKTDGANQIRAFLDQNHELRIYCRMAMDPEGGW